MVWPRPLAAVVPVLMLLSLCLLPSVDGTEVRQPFTHHGFSPGPGPPQPEGDGSAKPGQEQASDSTEGYSNEAPSHRRLFHYPGWQQNQTLRPHKIFPATSDLAHRLENSNDFAHCEMIVTNISYTSLLRDGERSELKLFVAALKAAIAHEAGEGIDPEDVWLKLEPAASPPNSIHVFAKIFSDKFHAVQWALNTTTTYDSTFHQSFAQVPDIRRVSTGEIHILRWLADREEEEEELEEIEVSTCGWFCKLLWTGLLSLLMLSFCCLPAWLFFGTTKSFRSCQLTYDMVEDTDPDEPKDLITVMKDGVCVHQLRNDPPPGVPVIADPSYRPIPGGKR